MRHKKKYKKLMHKIMKMKITLNTYLMNNTVINKLVYDNYLFRKLFSCLSLIN